jgi:hypothetical protein
MIRREMARHGLLSNLGPSLWDYQVGAGVLALHHSVPRAVAACSSHLADNSIFAHNRGERK